MMMTLTTFYKVSIHAPVMDAKLDIPMRAAMAVVSIHAPVMDAKLANVSTIIAMKSFNPRARDGRETKNLPACA